MPVYDYLCSDCGPFTEMRPMSECEDPNECPNCGDAAPRAYLTAPRLSGMSSDRMLAHSTNERNQHEPKSLSSMKQAHGSGCSCCSGGSKKPSRLTYRGKDGSKSFPTARPWMISH